MHGWTASPRPSPSGTRRRSSGTGCRARYAGSGRRAGGARCSRPPDRGPAGRRTSGEARRSRACGWRSPRRLVASQTRESPRGANREWSSAGSPSGVRSRSHSARRRQAPQPRLAQHSTARDQFMRRVGLEPTSPCGHRDLNPARLPISPPPRMPHLRSRAPDADGRKPPSERALYANLLQLYAVCGSLCGAA
jgi:hypothetical protein